MAPLRKITDRPTNMVEVLECGHSMPRPLSLGEDATRPSKVQRRRCYECEREQVAA